MAGKPEAPRGKDFFSTLFLIYILLIYRIFHFEAIQHVECAAYREFPSYFRFYFGSFSHVSCSCSECVYVELVSSGCCLVKEGMVPT